MRNQASKWFTLLALAVGLWSCGTRAVEEAEQRWQASGVTDYRLQAREFHSIWCYYDVSVEVRDGQVITATATAHYGPAQSCGLYGIDAVEEAVALAPETAARWTVPKLFELARSLEERLGEKKWKVTLEFDQELGFPRALFSDNEEMYDDDWSISVTRLEGLGP